LLKLSCIW